MDLFLAEDLEPFADEVLEIVVAIVALDLFLAAMAPFGAVLETFVPVVDLFVLASASAARLAINSCLLEQPVFCKIPLTIREGSLSIVAREAEDLVVPVEVRFEAEAKGRVEVL